MLHLIALSFLGIFFNFLILIADESFLLFVFLSFYYLILWFLMRFTIKSFIFMKVWKNFFFLRNLHWMNIYLVFLSSAFFLFLKSWLKPLKISNKNLLKNLCTNINKIFNNIIFFICLQIKRFYKKYFQFKYLSNFFIFDKYLNIEKI